MSAPESFVLRKLQFQVIISKYRLISKFQVSLVNYLNLLHFCDRNNQWKQKREYKNIVYIVSAVTKYLHTLYQYHQFCTVRAKKYILHVWCFSAKMSEVGVTGVSLNDLYLTKQQTNKNRKTEAVTGAWKVSSGMWDLESHPELRYLSMTEVTRVVLNAGLYPRAPQRRETPGASEARGVVG